MLNCFTWLENYSPIASGNFNLINVGEKKKVRNTESRSGPVIVE